MSKVIKVDEVVFRDDLYPRIKHDPALVQPFYFHEINLETGENVRMPALWYTKDEDKEKVKSFWRDVLKINK